MNICLNCSKEFTPSKHHPNNQRFCDVYCREAYNYKNRDIAKVKRMKREINRQSTSKFNDDKN